MLNVAVAFLLFWELQLAILFLDSQNLENFKELSIYELFKTIKNIIVLNHGLFGYLPSGSYHMSSMS